tara:strand:- start:70 stop:1053 length:984 start_codon:yes stop_codon:yes gene_type:complete
MPYILSISILFVFIATGCTSKQYFQAENTSNFNKKTLNLDSAIIDLNSNGATLEDYTYISKKGIHNELQVGYKFLNYTEDTLITANDNAEIKIKNKKVNITLSFDKNIISSSKYNNLLAFGSVDNSITLYDLDKRQILFKEYLKHSNINNIKIANPIFLNTVIFYPTLDGKIVVVNIKDKAIIQILNIDPKSDVNNVIFLEELEDALIASTSKKLFSFLDGKLNTKDIDIQSIILKDNFIYVATLDGKIIKYDIALNKIASKKFKFAKIKALAFGKDLYALESQGYLIRISTNFKEVKIFDFAFDEKEKVIGIENKIYFEDQYIKLD